jgi:hypothetical protein
VVRTGDAALWLVTVRTAYTPNLPAAVAFVFWLALALALWAPALALADRGGGDNDVRVSGSCGKGATSQLRLRTKDGAIELEFEVDANRAGQRWSVVISHERRVVWRGPARTRSSGGSFRIRRTIADFAGADSISVRASGPAGNTCVASWVLTD